MVRNALASFLLATGVFWAQPAPATVQAVGNASISVQPDQAQLSVSVSTQGDTADAAGQQNANTSFTLVTALSNLLGANGSIQTVSYSVYPRYANSQATTLVGYTAMNRLQVTINSLPLISKVIDTANQSGATSVGGLQLGLQNSESVMLQALAAAAKQAQTRAASIASGLGGKAGPVVSAVQGTTYTPILVGSVAGATASTMVQTGTVSVSATITGTFLLQ